jgi:hypothetical protein
VLGVDCRVLRSYDLTPTANMLFLLWSEPGSWEGSVTRRLTRYAPRIPLGAWPLMR